MRNILFVGGRYFPKASPNSICIKNIIDELPEEQYRIHLLCYKDGLDDDSKENITKISRGFIQSSLYKLEEKKGKFYQGLIRFLIILQKMKQIPFKFIWPWCDPIITLREVRAAEKIYQQRQYDTIIAVHMPLSSLIVGHMIKKRHPEIHFIAYFLDSLSGGAAPRFMDRNTYNKKALKWEEKVLDNANNIVFMEASQKYHEKAYENSKLKARITYLDLPMVKYQEIISEEDKKTIRFVYVGSLAPSVRSPEFFLKVFSKVAESNWELTFIGDDNCELLKEYANKNDRIRIIGRCTHEEALQHEKQATILLNLGNKNANLTPSKIFEYMSFGKKIVSTYPIDDEASKVYLDRYPNALLLDERSDVNEAAILLLQFVKQKMNKISYNELKQLFVNNTPEAFINIINVI